MTKNRLEAFSDGVFAIIITIMVLELKVPHGSEWTNLHTIIPKFISYVLSFLYIGIYWGNHHHLLNTAHKVNANIILANLNLLFWLSLIPFTTAWMGENHFESNPVALYGANMVLSAIAYLILQKSIEKSFEAEGELKHALIKHTKKGTLSLFAYLVSIPMAYINPYVSGVLFLIISIVWIIPDRKIEKAVT